MLSKVRKNKLVQIKSMSQGYKQDTQGAKWKDSYPLKGFILNHKRIHSKSQKDSFSITKGFILNHKRIHWFTKGFTKWEDSCPSCRGSGRGTVGWSSWCCRRTRGGQRGPSSALQTGQHWQRPRPVFCSVLAPNCPHSGKHKSARIY